MLLCCSCLIRTSVESILHFIEDHFALQLPHFRVSDGRFSLTMALCMLL